MKFKDMKLKDKIAFIEENAIGVMVLVATVVLIVNVILRYVFKDSTVWAEEFIRYTMIWITFFGAAVAFRRGTHFGVDLILRVNNKYFVKFVRCFIDATSIVFNCFVAYYGYQLVVFNMSRGQISASLGWSMWTVYLVIPISAALAILYVTINLIKKIKTPADQLMIRHDQ